MMLKKTSLLFSLLLLFAAAGEPFRDDFADPSLELRSAQRGDWTFVGQEARCVADPELYAKFKSHGPILRWRHDFLDGTVELEFQPEGCSKLALHLNNEIGHILRLSLSDESSSGIGGWMERSKTSKMQPIVKKGLPSLGSLDAQWVKVKLVIKGDRCAVQVGDYYQVIRYAGLQRDKTEVALSFADGACAVRNVSIL